LGVLSVAPFILQGRTFYPIIGSPQKKFVAEHKLRNSNCEIFPIPPISTLVDSNTPHSSLFSDNLNVPSLEEWHPVQSYEQE
jgi:hypothetical protein